ncbi:hypothetical protein D8674_003911 [Pyrus ussuriensis x Pyrus communis]|uniref:Uncharacterized protein n=1 Tax=Pyrus ussuriensis x Pyrus communis TaxID=2448454 RepID=A0A5N5FID4_9ROSA|nr:hypothetical protein D8674_003911 [Pyrus ussuriensis x Pyrus communis]
MTRQVEAHHYCAHQNEEMRQCLIYNGPEANAKLIGLEYVISEKLFMTLPDEEKPLWHSHSHEVKSGVLFMPGVCKTYGKVWHFWEVDKGDYLPLGIPKVMMALTRDGQLDEGLKRDMEKRYGVSFDEEKVNRAYMSGPEHGVHPLANGGGKGLTTELRETNCVGLPADSAALFLRASV